VRKELKILHLTLAVAVLSTVNLRADITSDSKLRKPVFSLTSHSTGVTGQAVQSTGVSPLAAIDGLKFDFQSPFNLDHSGKVAGSASQADVKELPAGPDSAMLFLCALGSLGVFHVGKSAKKLNFALVPDWYHSGGLRQVGHVHAMDSDFYLVAMPLAAFFDQQVYDPPKVFSYTKYEIAGRFESQFSLPIQAPRGPPILF